MFHRLFARTPILVGVIGLCLLVSGCGGSKVTADNAEKITTGMTEKEVSDILGSPTETSTRPSVRRCPPLATTATSAC